MPPKQNKKHTWASPFLGLSGADRIQEGAGSSFYPTSFLSPFRETQDLPFRVATLGPTSRLRTFVRAIFYVGKGSRARPDSHLWEALRHLGHPGRQVRERWWDVGGRGGGGNSRASPPAPLALPEGAANPGHLGGRPWRGVPPLFPAHRGSRGIHPGGLPGGGARWVILPLCPLHFAAAGVLITGCWGWASAVSGPASEHLHSSVSVLPRVSAVSEARAPIP